MTSFALTNFQKVRYFNLLFGVYRNNTPSHDICDNDPALVKFRWDLIEEESKELEKSLQEKDYPEILDALADILYVLLGASDSFGFNLDLQLQDPKIRQLIIDFKLDQLNYIEEKFSIPRMDKVFQFDQPLLESIHKKYQSELILYQLAMQKGDYTKLIDQLEILVYHLYVLAYLFGFSLDQVFDLVHQSNLSKLAETEEIAKKTVEWYHKNETRYDSPSYRLSTLTVSDKKHWVIYNQNSGKILKAINWEVANLKNYLQNPPNHFLKLGDLKITNLVSPTFLTLSNKSKMTVLGVTEIINHGQDVLFFQKFHLGLVFKKLITKIYLHFRYNPVFVTEHLTQWGFFVKYVYLFWISNGIYDLQTTGEPNEKPNQKIIVEFSLDFWNLMIKSIGNIKLSGLESTIERYLWKNTFRNNQVQMNNLYLGVLPKDAQQFYELKEKLWGNVNPKPLLGINTRVVMSPDENIREQSYLPDQLCGESIKKIIESLESLMKLDSELDSEMINPLLEHFKTGDLEALNKYLIAYSQQKLLDLLSFEWCLGFLDRRADLFNRKGLWMGHIYFPKENNQVESLFLLGPPPVNYSIIPQKWGDITGDKTITSLNTPEPNSFYLNSYFSKDAQEQVHKLNYMNLDDYILDHLQYNHVDSLPFFDNEI